MNRTPSTEPAEWTIEDVIHYIGVTDPALGQHADLFRKHVRNMHFMLFHIYLYIYILFINSVY